MVVSAHLSKGFQGATLRLDGAASEYECGRAGCENWAPPDRLKWSPTRTVRAEARGRAEALETDRLGAIIADKRIFSRVGAAKARWHWLRSRIMSLQLVGRSRKRESAWCGVEHGPEIANWLSGATSARPVRIVSVHSGEGASSNRERDLERAAV
jgi:hypothetical protein